MALGGLEPVTRTFTRYQMLDVEPEVSPEEIHRGYRRMAMLYHPDRHLAEDQEIAQASFHLISEAFQILSDPDKRARYDRALARGEDSIDDDVATIDFASILRRMEQFEDPLDAGLLAGKLSGLNSMVADNLIHDIGEHVMNVWPMETLPPGITVEGKLKIGAAVLTNVRLLVPFVTQWVTRSGNTKTTHSAQHILVCALHLTDRIELEECGKLVSTINVRFIQPDRTVEFQTRRRNLGKLLLVARSWNIPVQGSRQIDRKAERKWAFRPLRWFAWIAGLYMVCMTAGMSLFGDDKLPTAVHDMLAAIYPVGAWLGLLFLGWAISRVYRWIKAYGAQDLADLAQVPQAAVETRQVQVPG